VFIELLHCCHSSFDSTLAGALEDVVDVFFEVAACEASSVNLVVDNCKVVSRWSPFMYKLGDLDMAAD